MFTSKKAQYLDNYFGKISPITNIDSLYYEQAIVDPNNNSSINIFRKSVVKNMPVQMMVQNSSNELDSLEYSQSICTSINSSISLNIFPTKTNLRNFNHLDFNIFTVDTSKYVNLKDLIVYYTPVSKFNSSIENVNSSILNVNTSLNNSNSSLNDVSGGLHELINDVSQLYVGDYNGDVSKYDQVHSIVPLIFGKWRGELFGILTQYVNINNDISTSLILQNAFAYNHKNTIFASYNNINCFYDNSSILITYIKDPLNGNEIYNSNLSSVDPNDSLLSDVSILYDNKTSDNIINSFLSPHYGVTDESEPQLEYTSKNKILYSKDVSIIGYLNTTVGSNTIINSGNILITYKNVGDIVINNKIINCSTYNIKIYGSNNLLVNCNNSSIHINGDNNILINVKNQDISINSNTVIINDSTKTTNYNNIVFDNCKFFFGNSVSTGMVNNLNQNVTVFGGQGNDVSVYANMATF